MDQIARISIKVLSMYFNIKEYKMKYKKFIIAEQLLNIYPQYTHYVYRDVVYYSEKCLRHKRNINII